MRTALQQSRKFSFVLFWVFLSFFAKGQSLEFWHLSVEQGLSNANVNCFLQDKNGFMWIGTDDGLNRYDGYDFKVFRHEARNPHSLAGNIVKYLHEDPDGNLWVAGDNMGNLCRYDPRSGKFELIKGLRDAKLASLVSDCDGHLWSVNEGKLLRIDRQNLRISFQDVLNHQYAFSHLVKGNDGEVWLLSTNHQVVRFNPKTGSARVHGEFPRVNRELVQRLYVDGQDRLWFSLRGAGLHSLDTQGKLQAPYPADLANLSPKATSDNRILVFASQGELLYLGTETKGPSVLNTRTGTFWHYPHLAGNPKSVAANSTHALYIDRQKRLWVGSFAGGISIADPLRQRFGQPGVALPNQTVNAILEDRQGRLWVGTEGGLALRENGQVRHLVHRPGNPAALRSNPILALAEDRQGRVWVGTWDGGLHRYDDQLQGFVNYSPNSKGTAPIADNKIMGLAVERQTGQIMATTYFKGFSVLVSEEKGEFKNFRHDPQNPSGLTHDMGTRVYQDPQGRIWVGTEKGLNRFDRAKGTFAHYRANPAEEGSLANDFITTLFGDSQGRFWVGTGDGLHQWLGEGRGFRAYTQADGLPGNFIHGILEDGGGRLWISTNNGISRFDPAKGTFQNYDEEDGLPGKQFKSGAAFRAPSGVLYFGSIRGLSAFHPDSILDNPHPPQVVLTNFKLANREVAIGGADSILRQAVAFQKEITLSHRQSIFSIEFVGINFTQPHKNRYAYRLVPLEQDWNYVGSNQRQATYTSLPAGDYTFEVRAANNDGRWNEAVTTLQLHILPPWWETWWFRSLALGLLLGAGGVFYRVRTRFLKEQNQKLERQVVERTQEIELQRQKLAEANNDIQAKADELQASEEELRQNMEELEASQELLKNQKETIETAFGELHRQNTKINDSIRYAKRIQQAILPEEGLLASAFAEHFVIFRPKDVVSGDFYWYNEVDGKKFIAVVDCTGHGVPGAFMSMIGSTILQEITSTKRISEPHLVLQELHQGIYNSISKRDNEMRDGMDLALCIIEPAGERVRVSFSGAKRPLFYCSAGQLHEVRADRMSIGQADFYAPFSTHELDLVPGDVLYMTTDGWIDALGPGRQKFGSPRFKQMLSEGAFLPLAAQRDMYTALLDEFSGSHDQRDDVLLLGVRV
jgi:ligand-binding sensor domain-containing protein/serine phosphatase RsbU (regulator of sigma subunit)